MTDDRHAATANQKPAAPLSLEDRYNQAEQRATDLTLRYELASAEGELRRLLPDAEAAGDFTALWLHHEIAWLRWLARDSKGCLDELDAIEAYMDRAQFFGNSSRYEHVYILWCRAYFLLEDAYQAPLASRAGALARAQAAQRSHAAEAGDIGKQAEADLLAALFAVRAGNRALAAKRSQSFQLIEEPDAAQLLAMIQVYIGIGDREAAIAARKKLEQAQVTVVRGLALRTTDGLGLAESSPPSVPLKQK